MMLGQSFDNDFLFPIRGKEYPISPPMASNLTILKGDLLAEITATAANEVQTLSQSSGSASAGTFTLTFGDYTTSALAYNATAAQVQAALRLLPNIGAAGVTCTGGALPGTPIVITFGGPLANLGQNLITVTNSTLNGSAVYAVARTTAGVPKGRWVKWDPSTIADPTGALTVSAAAGGTGTWAAGSYAVQHTWVNAQGETKAGLTATIALAATNELRIAAINAAGTPDDATALNIYVNGAFVKQIAVTTPGTSGNVAQTDITGPAAGGGKPLPEYNSAFIYGDGRQLFKGVARLNFRTDNAAWVTFGSTSSKQLGNGSREGLAYNGGTFMLGALLYGSNLTELIRQTGARFAKGSSADTTSELLIPAA